MKINFKKANKDIELFMLHKVQLWLNQKTKIFDLCKEETEQGNKKVIFHIVAHIAKFDEIFDDYIFFVIGYCLITLNTELFKEFLFFGWQTTYVCAYTVLDSMRFMHIKIFVYN